MPINPKVVDLSHYDTIEDLAQVKAFGILGIINKATEGPGMTDKTFEQRLDPVRKAGFLYGAYHFLRPGNIAAQVDHFFQVTDPDENLLVALDHEDQRVPLDDARDWLSRAHEKIGRWPVLYSGFLIKQQLGNRKDAMLSGCRLWLAHYSSTPTWPPNWSKPWLHQYTGDGVGPGPHNVPGITIPGSDGIDINSYDGTDEQLAASWAA